MRQSDCITGPFGVSRSGGEFMIHDQRGNVVAVRTRKPDADQFAQSLNEEGYNSVEPDGTGWYRAIIAPEILSINNGEQP